VNVLLLGAEGQLGWELRRCVPPGVILQACSRQALDICDEAALNATLDARRTEAVINAAAYTAVDRAEQETERAFAVNGSAPGMLARAAAARGARFIHVSTDFVFNGRASEPYATDAPTDPLGAYGRSKLAGEDAIRASGARWLILRSAWVYSAHGNNFVKTMLRLMREKGAVRVVADQVGSPTWAQGLALAIWRALACEASGLHHWTDAGVASWYEFASAIAEEAFALGILSQPAILTPITTRDYPTPAQRPAYSVLDKSVTWEALGLCAPAWRSQLRGMLNDWKGMMHA
jgi:dTDP-4-dehydrorhamnose reductase